MPRITSKNYYLPENTYISSSKLKTFLKDKALYKRKYIDWTEDHKKTDTLITGSAVDALLTKGRAYYNKNFVVMERRSSKTDDAREQLTPLMSETVEKIVESVKRQAIWNDLKNKKWKKQVIITNDKLNICGMLDFLLVDEKKKQAIIVDLKTTTSINSHKYEYTCIDYGYFLQMAFYRLLVALKYDKINEIHCYHLAVEKDPDGIYDCGLFRFMEDDLVEETKIIFDGLEALRKEKKFAPKSVGWDDYAMVVKNF